MKLTCAGLTKDYGTKRAVDGVDLAVEPGDIFGLLGPNGAGKSTLIKLMTGLIWPTAGSVALGEYDVHDRHAEAMAQVGAIIEWPAFLPYLTARQNLQILSGGHGPAFDRALQEAVDFVNMAPNLDKPVDRFSTGMKQRLGIALALLPASRFIILDEPTNGLDPNGIFEVRDLLRERSRRYGTTILLSSHLLAEVEHVCNRIAILHRGRIVLQGPLQELLARSVQLRIVATPRTQAHEILGAWQNEAHTPIASVTEAPPALLVGAPRDAAAAINARLHDGGCAVSHLAVEQRTLEDLFTEITGGETDVA